MLIKESIIGALVYMCLAINLMSAMARERRIKRTATIPGDIMVGALFSVHRAPGQKQAQTRTCGDIWEQYGIQRVEASFQTVDEINANRTLLPNITLGIEIRDSCWYSPIALDQSIEFIRDAINMNEDVSSGNATNASSTSSDPDCLKPTKTLKNLVGVIGPGSSTVTIQVQNLLQLFSIPQIGYSATSRDLSDKSFYKYFLRVVPSDFYQAQVMVDLVRSYNWTYISAVHTDGNYGGSGMDAFIKLAHEAGICIATSDSVLSNAEDAAFDDVIKALRKYPTARVVVCFCEGRTVRGLLKAIRRLNASGEFLLIGSDGWSDRHDVTEKYEHEAHGGISIRIHSTYDHSFDSYYFKLNPHNNTRNPWFREFWEIRFNCSLEKSTLEKFNQSCTGRENLSDRYTQDTKMSFVKKAIYTMAYGLHDMQKAKCNNTAVGLCPEMLPINGSLFLQYLLNVSFVWENEAVKFDEKGDPPGRLFEKINIHEDGWIKTGNFRKPKLSADSRVEVTVRFLRPSRKNVTQEFQKQVFLYDVMNFQRNESGTYFYKHVGAWDSGKLIIMQPLQWNPEHQAQGIPESVCSKPCERGKVKSIQSESVKCCWVCVACKENQYLLDEYTCQDCPLGWWPNDNLTDCDRIPVEYIQWTDTTAIVACSIACMGFIATTFTMVVFIKHNNTPVVKASTRELSYVILVGMYLCYGCTFPLLAKPTQTSCFLTRVLPGLSFAMMYASLLTKTNRIARILAGSKKKIITKKPRFMSGNAQLVITWILISIESGIIAAMLFMEPANSMYSYPTLYKVCLICNTTPLGIIAPLGFDFFLIAMCTVYAVKTRNVPENFNEAKFIGFTMYTTLVIWTAFVPIYFGSSSKVITMCLCVSFSAIVALVLLFFPKLYIILFRPERNNRSAFTTAKDVRCHIGYPTTATSRNSSHSTSEFSLESPRNLSLDIVNKSQQKHDPSDPRRHSMNLFERFRISKQDKIAANVAQHIRAVRAAEALDRRTHLRRTDSFNLPDMSGILPIPRSTSSGCEESPGALHEKRRLVTMLKQAYGSEVGASADATRSLTQTEEAACQTSYDLLEALLPSLRKRMMRSETVVSHLNLEDEELKRFPVSKSEGSSSYHHLHHQNHPLFGSGDKYRHYSICGTNHASVNFAYDDQSPLSQSVVRKTKSRMRTSNGNVVEVEYKMSELSDLADPLCEESDVISLKEVKRAKTLALLGKRSQYNKLHAVSDKSRLQEKGDKDGSFSPAISQDSLIDAGSSIIEESASTGSDETPGGAVYKNIIISLGQSHDRSRSSFGGSQFSTTENLLPSITDAIQQEGENKTEKDSSDWRTINGNSHSHLWKRGQDSLVQNE